MCKPIHRPAQAFDKIRQKHVQDPERFTSLAAGKFASFAPA